VLIWRISTIAVGFSGDVLVVRNFREQRFAASEVEDVAWAKGGTPDVRLIAGGGVRVLALAPGQVSWFTDRKSKRFIAAVQRWKSDGAVRVVGRVEQWSDRRRSVMSSWPFFVVYVLVVTVATWIVC
jgi:hypothetical protein